jgi:hypothetical protein
MRRRCYLTYGISEGVSGLEDGGGRLIKVGWDACDMVGDCARYGPVGSCSAGRSGDRAQLRPRKSIQKLVLALDRKRGHRATIEMFVVSWALAKDEAFLLRYDRCGMRLEAGFSSLMDR